MRLWHVDLIPLLPRQQLLGQHRECCAMRGKGWGKKHSTVDYVWKYNFMMLFEYHAEVMFEMERRGFSVGQEWWSLLYRGKKILCMRHRDMPNLSMLDHEYFERYPEHNDAYYKECIDNLRAKGIEIESEES